MLSLSESANTHSKQFLLPQIIPETNSSFSPFSSFLSTLLDLYSPLFQKYLFNKIMLEDELSLTLE